jgi:hypothetical protein
MADMMSILSANYKAVGLSAGASRSKYVNVDPKAFQGTWTAKYANGKPVTVSISNVSGFRAKVKFQTETSLLYQEVLIKDDGFRIGDNKFTVTRKGVAQIRSVVTNPATGGSSLETTFAKQG